MERRFRDAETREERERPREAEPQARAYSAEHVLALQRGAGNQAVQRMLDAGGRTARPTPEDPELMEDRGGDPEDGGTPVPTGGGSAAPTVPITVTSSNFVAPIWQDHGAFNWQVAFATTGRSGWLVQEITATRSGTTSSGAVAAPTTPHYWEAWSVDAAGAVNPGASDYNDQWSRRAWGTGSKGKWTMGGKVHFTTTNPSTQGFTAGGVPEAGDLLSTTTAPTGLGDVKLTRHANGDWDSTGATPKHTGSAGP